MATRRSTSSSGSVQTTNYKHSQKAVQRPEVGVQDQFNTKKSPRTYRYDSSLDPALSWDENRDRELAEWLIQLVQRCAVDGEAATFAQPQAWAGGGVQVQSLKAAADLLKALSQPFLNWTGKAERHQISVPTVPLFVHEQHSTKAILDGIKHRKAKGTTFDLFGDGGGLDVTDKLDAYEHKGPWQNRMVLGDSLQVMNSLLEFEGLGGQVQMVYIDPPYGVKYGSNFQPFVRKRDVKHGGDSDMTREPEMVKAYRDTWELGLHSYLTYLRDRFLLTRELLSRSGSIFVQISDENLHHVRELMDEVFGPQNFVAIITYAKTTSTTSEDLSVVNDYIIWYARDKEATKKRMLYKTKRAGEVGGTGYTKVFLPNGEVRPISDYPDDLPANAKLCATGDLTSSKPPGDFPVEFKGKQWRPTKGYWKTGHDGMKRLLEAKRVYAGKTTLGYIRLLDDFPCFELNNIWTDTVGQNQFGPDGKVYAVQTANIAIQRCMLMCTEPGDLVFDPTCGSGTTAYVAEQWGRRWITCDTSRVPLALARQRLLTATFPYYELKDPQTGPQGGFVYKRRQNRKGEEVGGLVPHITLKSIANDEQPVMEVLVDRPEVNDNVTRVAGPFVVEATIAPAQTVDPDGGEATVPVKSMDGALGDADAANSALPHTATESVARYGDPATHIERMTQVLRQSKTLRLPGNRELVLADIRRMADSDALHAEGLDAEGNRIAVVFGPEDGAITSDLVFEAAREAYFLKFPHLYFFGFAIQAKARELLEDRNKLRVPCTYVTVTPDVAMSDLLKTSRASEIFSVTGLPDVAVRKTGKKNDDGAELFEVELNGLDIFNPATMKQEAIEGQSVPAWMLDTDYDGMCFYATQVFFPKTAAWDNLRKSLKAEFVPSVWEHLAGTVSEPFPMGSKRRVAVKVIDERGNELMRVVEVKV
ncbi:site-specific DNA-methyltransferase [Caballeronia telluris]|uniref:Type III DNA modification methyltransferase n=1 Tax=Caballeronia telluris TaxID=326475 RepID=A0A158FJE6_9BURK|nr:site-specific DNA-methyltransferase [Caballeronia telluris]SAL19865.1 type III DNA modification methyltransferase [Caballeronia telluris]